MLAPGAHKSTGIYPTTSGTQQRWGSISNLMICRGMALLFCFYAQIADNMTTHRKSHGYTQITKPKFKHGKWECVKTKQACLRSQTRTPPQVFSWKSTLAPLNPASSGRSPFSRLRPQRNQLIPDWGVVVCERFFFLLGECSLCWPLWQRGALYLLSTTKNGITLYQMDKV